MRWCSSTRCPPSSRRPCVAPRGTARSELSLSSRRADDMTHGATPTDWTTDYDIFDDGFVRDPYPKMSEIRESRCPIAHTERWGGSWMPTRYEDVVAVAQ